MTTMLNTRGVEKLVTHRIDDVPEKTIRMISEKAAVYGSKAIVVMVATELLIRQKKPIRVRYQAKKEGKKETLFISLRPRTIQLLNRLTPVYGTGGEVMMACGEILRNKGKD